MVSISDKCPGHPFLNFLDPPLKGTSKTLCREEPNMSTVFTKNTGMMVLCLKKPWATCKGIGSPMQVPQFLKNRLQASLSAYITIYACYERVGYAGISICFTLYRKIVKFSKSVFISCF